MSFFLTLDPLLQTLWFIALPVSLVFIIQIIMTVIGMDASDNLDASFSGKLNTSDDSGSFQLLTFRNLVNFLLSFSWAGITLFTSISSITFLLSAAFFIGTSFVLLYFMVTKAFHHLSEGKTFKISDTLGKTASVYLSIPENKKGTGKIQVSVRGNFYEVDAITEHDGIDIGTMVRINAIIDNRILLVERI